MHTSVAMAPQSDYLFRNRSLHIFGHQFNDVVKQVAGNANIRSVPNTEGDTGNPETGYAPIRDRSIIARIIDIVEALGEYMPPAGPPASSPVYRVE